MTAPRTPEDIATRDLYRIIYTHKETTRYEDVKECIDRGAKLVGIEASYGIPLIFAIRSGCDISIIKLLVESSGCDLNYISYEKNYLDIHTYKKQYIPKLSDIYPDTEQIHPPFILETCYVRCITIKNTFIRMYHTSINSPVLQNRLFTELAKKGCCVDVNILQHCIEDIPEHMTIVNPTLHEYTKQCCELAGIDFETLKYAEEQLVPTSQFHVYHMIPTDKHPYNWNYKRDVLNIQSNIDDSSDEEGETATATDTDTDTEGDTHTIQQSQLNKRLTIPRTPEDIATRDLYRIIHTHEENTRYEDVKDCIDRGAKLVGIEASYGIPLIFAIRSGCDISIIKLLVEFGGCDIEYKTVNWYTVCIWKDDDTELLLYKSYLDILSIQNILVRMYHKAIGSSSVINQVSAELFKQGCIETTVYKKDTSERYSQQSYDYVKQCCELVGLDFETLKTKPFELCSDILGVKESNKIPKDKHPYNWNYTRDVLNIEYGIEYSSEEDEDESDSV